MYGKYKCFVLQMLYFDFIQQNTLCMFVSCVHPVAVSILQDLQFVNDVGSIMLLVT